MNFILGTALAAVAMFGGLFYNQTKHFDEQVIACKRAEGHGEFLKSKTGMPIGYECMRMHLVLKFRNGEYK